MYLSEPPRSPYDWQFFLWGFPVRVTWLFWLTTAFLGYDWAQSLDRMYAHLNLETPGFLILLLIWTGMTLLSILVHELGHSLAMRWYGIPSHIVLYHFGGLAVPETLVGWRRVRLRPLDQIVVSAAGPAIQLLLGLTAAAITLAAGLQLGMGSSILDWIIPLPPGEYPQNAALLGIIDSLVNVSIWWALLNLLPVLPLDGGRIAEQLIGLKRGGGGFYEATLLSIVVSIVVAFIAFRDHQSSLGMFFFVMALLNLQSLRGDTWSG